MGSLSALSGPVGINETWLLAGVPAMLALAGVLALRRGLPGLVWPALISAAWLLVMVQLLVRDMTWQTGQAPTPPIIDDIPAGYTESFVIFTEKGGQRVRLGEASAWHQYAPLDGQPSISSRLMLDRLPGLSGLPGLGEQKLVITSQMRRKTTGGMDGFETEVAYGHLRFKVAGTVTAGYCLARVEIPGLKRRLPSLRFPVDDQATEIGQQFQNFALMPDLRLGQSWQVRMIDTNALLRGIISNPRLLRDLLGTTQPQVDPRDQPPASNPQVAPPDKLSSNDDPQPSSLPKRRGAQDPAPVNEPEIAELGTLPFEDHMAQVVAQETILWNGAQHQVWVVEQHKVGNRSQILRSYVDQRGRVLRQIVGGGVASQMIVERKPEESLACIVHGDLPGRPYLIRQHDNRVVWFCCSGCRDEWDKLTGDRQTQYTRQGPSLPVVLTPTDSDTPSEN